MDDTDTDTEEEAALRPVRSPYVYREHILQKWICKFVAEVVAVPHEFFSFDRARGQGRFAHARQAARGVRSGTPDTLLCVQNLRPVWVELKPLGGNKPDDNQKSMIGRLQAIGHYAAWTNTVEGYSKILLDAHVPMPPNAWLIARDYDAKVLAETDRAVLASRKRGPKKKLPRYLATKRVMKAARKSGIML